MAAGFTEWIQWVIYAWNSFIFQTEKLHLKRRYVITVT